MPYSRPTLFISNLISGLILILTPIIINALTLIPFVEPTFKHLHGGKENLERNNSYSPWETHIDLGDLTRWLVSVLVIALFIYAISVLAGIITGNIAIHVLVSALLNVIAPVMYLITQEYLGSFLYGYGSGYQTDITTRLHPLSSVLDKDGVGLLSSLVYVAVAIVCCIAALILYRILKVERSTDVFTFKAANYVLVSILSLMGMSFVGFLFTFMAGGFFVGAAIGGVITFMLSLMIVRKSAKIFDKAMLKSFGCFVLIAVVFVVFTTTNITGYETREPALEKVKSIGVDISGLGILPYLYPGTNMPTVKLTTPDAKKVASELRKAIVAEKDNYRYQSIYDYADLETIPFDILFEYKSKNNRTIWRFYRFEPNLVWSGEAFAKFYSNPEVKQVLLIKNMIGYDDISGIDITYFDTTPVYLDNTYTPLIVGDEMAEFAKCLDDDFERLQSKELTGFNSVILTFQISYRDLNAPPSQPTYSYGKDGEALMFLPPSYSYSINDKYTSSIAWLKDHGYYDALTKSYRELESQLK
jgi:ABC-2 type transport system permease protein